MAQLFRYFQGDPVVTSSPTEVRMWVEDLDYNFLVYGEIFESAEINGEKLLNITRNQLNELGIVRTDHQDILLNAVARIRKKGKVEEQAMHREDQNIKKMPTRFGKESEQLEHAIDCVLATISERRLARSLHGTIEQPPYSILTATLELVNTVNMILNILERPPFDCMSEFSSVKNHLIKHITLLKYYSEQSDLSHENESDIIDVCKGMTKMCHYIIALPPELPKPEIQVPGTVSHGERSHRMQVPITTEPETMSSSVQHEPDFTTLIQQLSMPITTTILSCGTSIQYTSLPNQGVSGSYSSSQRVNTPSDEEAVVLEHDKGNKFETQIPDTDASDTLGGSFSYKTLQDLTIIESDTPLIDSGSEQCVIGSDSDRGVVSDFELEELSKDFGSIIWGMDSDSERSPSDSESTKHLLKGETYQLDSVFGEDLTKTGKHLVRIEQCQVESGSLRHWVASGSEKLLGDSDSEIYSDSDNERKKEEEMRQMSSDSIKRMMESENTMMESENFWMIPDSESYAVGSYTEKGGASVSKVHMTQVDKTEKPRVRRYVIDSDSDSNEMDLDSERRELASAAVMCFTDTKTFHQSTAGNNLPKDSWSERRTVNSDSENPVMSSDSVKHMKKAKTCKSTCNLGRLKMAHRSESLQHWLDAKTKELDSDHGGLWDSSGKYHCKSVIPSFGKSQHDLQTFQSITEEDQVGSSSEKHQTQPGNERDRNEPESKRHLIKTEKGLDNKEFQMDREREGYLVESDRHDSENEAHRLGARRKDNRPPGFWRPVILPPKLDHEKKTEEQKSVQQKDSRVCRIQCRKYRSEDKTVRSKETSNLSYKQVSREKLKERHTYSSLTDEKIHRKASQKVSLYKRHCKEYGYTHSCESFRYQVTPNPLSSETCISNISSLVDSPTCESPKSVTRQKARRSITFSLDVGTQRCTRCFMEISTSSFHKCLMNSDDSDSDSSLHGQSSSHCKYSLSSETVRHYKTSRNRPLSQSLDPKHHVGIRCLLHREDSKCSMDSSSYLHCESCSALQKRRGSSSTHTISTDTKKIRDQGHIMSAPVRLSQSESKFNLTTQLQNKDNPEDSNIKFISTKSVEAKANILVSKDDTDHDDETTTEDETEVEYETDTEDEDDTKDKKDPKDKSDPDGSSYPEGGSSENNTDSNNGSNPSGASGPTSGPDSSNDGDSKNITDDNKSDPTVENASNSDINLKYSTDEMCTNNLDNASDEEEYFNQRNDANCKADTNPTCASGNENRTVMDCISGCNNDTDPKNPTGQERYNVHSEIIRSLSNSPDFIKNENDPSINASSQNSRGPLEDLNSNSNSKPSSATSHDVVSTNNIADPYYGKKPTSTAIYKYTAMLNYYSDLNDVTVFKYKVSSSFIVNSMYFDKKKYAMRPNFTPSTVNAINTSKITSCTSAITAGKNYAPDTKHFPRFSHINSFNIIINANNSTSTSDINNVPVTELEINSTSSVLKIVYGNISNFIFGTNYTYPDFLIASKFYDPLELSRAYTIFDNQNIGALFQHSAIYMDSHNCEYATGSMDAIDAKESGFVKDFSRVQNPIGIKGLSPFKLLSYQNVLLPSFDIIVEAELPDILKFAISSGAMKQSFELSDDYSGASRAEGGSLAVPMREITGRPSEVPIWRTAEGPTWGPEEGRPVRFERGCAVNPARDLAVRPEKGLTMIPARGRSVSPVRGYSERCGRERAVSLTRGYTKRQAVSSAQEIALRPTRRLPMRHEEEFILGAAVGLTVKPAEGYDEETSTSARQLTQTTDDDDVNENESGSSIIMDFINCFMKAKAQNWIDLSWFRRLLPTFFSEEDRRSWSKTRFCAIACTELGHGKCEGWLWHKRESRGISFFSWKKYWFILKHSTLYWFSHLNDTKADGFIYLPEFRIDLAPHCRRDHAFQATHARIKDFYFAGTCLDEMNYWVCQMLQLAFGSSFGDAAVNAEYRRMSAMLYAKCLMALKRNFPVIWCNYCEEATTIVSMNPNFQYRRPQHISDEFIYFRPINAEMRERARKQKQQNPTLISQQPTREGIHQRDLGLMSQVVMVTTPPMTNELESTALVKPKTSGLLRIEKISIKSPGVPEFQRLDVTGIASPEERGKGTAILVAGVPGKEELDDTEIPTLQFTGFVHLEALINKSSPSSEYSRPGTPRNLWMESPENAESPGSEDMEVARSMYPFRERSIFRRSWAELLEAPLNSEGLHILQTVPNNQDRDMGFNKLTSEEENQVTTHPKDQHFQALQGPFPMLPERPKLQRQRSRSLPRYSEIRGKYLNAPEFEVNTEESRFSPCDHNLLTEENIKKRYNMEGAWQKEIPSHSGHLPIKPKFDNSAIRGNNGMAEDNSARSRGNGRIPKNNVNTIPMVNVGIPIDNPQVPRGNAEDPRGSGFGGHMGNSGRISRPMVSSPLIELSKIGEHQL